MNDGQRLDGFGVERYGILQWEALLRLSTVAECATRNGAPVCVAGMSEPWPGMAIVWATVGRESGPSMIPIMRRIVRTMQSRTHVRRFQTTVRLDFLQGHRWAAMLGFRPECTMERYDQHGQPHVLYARIFER